MDNSQPTGNASRLQDLTDQRFDRWFVTGPSPVRISGKRHWVCRCDCGNIGCVTTSNLRSGNSKSCGCLSVEARTAARFKHGASRTPELSTWRNMIRRCTEPKSSIFKFYGGRGIRVCDRWLGDSGFVNFLSDVGKRPSPKHTIDRIDVYGNYCPENCRWATRKEQGRNRRDNRLVTMNGQTKCLAEWSELTGLKAKTIECRLERGMSSEDALLTPNGISTRLRKTNRMLTHNGVTLCLAEWADRLGVAPENITARLRRGQTLEEALTGPQRRSRR